MKKIVGFFIVVGVILYVGYEALMYYDNNFRYGRMRETPAVRPHEDPLLKMEEGIVPVSGGEAIYRTTAGANLVSPLNSTEPSVTTRGKAVYMTYLPNAMATITTATVRWAKALRRFRPT